MPKWVRWVVVLALAVLALLILWRLLGVVITVLVALLITCALRPIVSELERRHVPRLAGIALCYLVLAGLLAGLIWFIIPIGISQAHQLRQEIMAFSRSYGSLQRRYESWRQLLPVLPPASQLAAIFKSSTMRMAVRMAGAASGALTLFVRVMSVLLLSFFFLFEGERILDDVLALLGPRAHREVPPRIERIGNGVGRYALGQFVEMCIVGALDGLGMFLLGVHFPVLLGVLAGISDVIPYFGPIIAAVPAALIGLSQSLWLASYAVLVYAAVHALEANILNPYVVGRFVGLRPVWVVVAVLIGESLMGIVGMVLAVPAATVIHLLLREVYLPWLQRKTRRHQAE
ncbi:MAG: AI-2E family transporter [Cyanobacteria bacterium REEB65]|nr:AI-2E family transporter [Cyanobacteria bacterium REEB65]